MKKRIKFLLIVAVSTLATVVDVFAQPQPPAPDPGATSPIAGAPLMNCTAPIGDGYWVILILALGYSTYLFWKTYKAKTE